MFRRVTVLKFFHILSFWRSLGIAGIVVFCVPPMFYHTRSLMTSEEHRTNFSDYSIILHNPSLCQVQNITLLALVQVGIDNFAGRVLLRQTWANSHLFKEPGIVTHAFVVGTSTDPDTTAKLQEEFSTHGDIIQGNFIDSYTNITLKVFTALQYVHLHCQHVAHILKIDDDDIFFNVFQLLQNLSQLLPAHSPGILCHVNESPVVQRRGKWKVSHSDYPLPLYPPFCTGPAYVMTSGAASELYVAALNSTHLPYIWIEDVYFTGILAHAMGIPLKRASKLFLSRTKDPSILEVVAEFVNCSQPIQHAFVHTWKWRHHHRLYLRAWAALIQCLSSSDRDRINRNVLRWARTMFPACSKLSFETADQPSRIHPWTIAMNAALLLYISSIKIIKIMTAWEHVLLHWGLNMNPLIPC